MWTTIVAQVTGSPSSAPREDLTQATGLELGDCSVDFEVDYWTAPEQASTIQVRDRVLRTCTTALEDAGITIPWPLRTVAWDGPLAMPPTAPSIAPMPDTGPPA